MPMSEPSQDPKGGADPTAPAEAHHQPGAAFTPNCSHRSQMLLVPFCFPSRETARLLSHLNQHQLLPPQITGLSSIPPHSSRWEGIAPKSRPLPAGPWHEHDPGNGLVTQKKEIVFDRVGKVSCRLPRGERGPQGPCWDPSFGRGKAAGSLRGRIAAAGVCQAVLGLQPTSAGAHSCTRMGQTRGGARGA